jgi:hypothetical protein
MGEEGLCCFKNLLTTKMIVWWWIPEALCFLLEHSLTDKEEGIPAFTWFLGERFLGFAGKRRFHKRTNSFVVILHLNHKCKGCSVVGVDCCWTGNRGNPISISFLHASFFGDTSFAEMMNIQQSFSFPSPLLYVASASERASLFNGIANSSVQVPTVRGLNI